MCWHNAFFFLLDVRVSISGTLTATEKFRGCSIARRGTSYAWGGGTPTPLQPALNPSPERRT